MDALPAYFAALGAEVPAAPVLHMLNHVVSSLWRFGVSRNSSTETLVELPHRLAAKAPSKHISRTDMLEFGALDVVLVYDAMVTQFAYRAMYDQAALVCESWGAVLQPIIDMANTSRPFVFAAPQDSVLDAAGVAMDNNNNPIDDDTDLPDLTLGLGIEVEVEADSITSADTPNHSPDQPLSGPSPSQASSSSSHQVGSQPAALVRGEVGAEDHRNWKLLFPVGLFRWRVNGAKSKELVKKFTAGLAGIERCLATYISSMAEYVIF
ncbi:hypothetical protein BC828DRAFT_421504 [Blastocladiella britannica]|nr:hypothetical protein BC828DRAFT_421504 [Blastocladiella britannica]